MIDTPEIPLPCARCRSLFRRVGRRGLCHDCERFLLSADRHRRPPHRPEGYELDPWQENAIRHLEEGV